MNLSFCNLSKEFTDGLYVGYQQTLQAVKYLGERIKLALNFFRGKTNEEIKKVLDKTGDINLVDNRHCGALYTDEEFAKLQTDYRVNND
jgi:hypothetical protein